MENRAHALAAGLFTLILAAALVAAGLWFRRDDIRFAQYLVTTTGSVTGLKVEAPVRYRGVDVGRVEWIRIGPQAGDETTLAVIGGSQSFGEMALLDGGPRAATVTTLEPTNLMAVPRDGWLGLIAADPTLSTRILHVVGNAVRVAGHRRRLRVQRRWRSGRRQVSPGSRPSWSGPGCRRCRSGRW